MAHFNPGVVFMLALHVAFSCGQDEKVLMKDIKVITLRAGAMTANRRVPPVAQLSCIGGSAGSFVEYHPQVVQCTNQGSDGSATNMQWRCEAELDTNVRFGDLRVGCEGYSDSKDPYVLKGSCGLSYMLELTEQGRSKLKGDRRHKTEVVYHPDARSYGGWSSFGTFVFIAFAIFFLARACSSRSGSSYSSRHHARAYEYDAPLPTPGPGTSFVGGMLAGAVLNQALRPTYAPVLPIYHAPSFPSFGFGGSSDFGSTTHSSVGFADSSNR
eukprot:TRINITY_DN11529_c0_g1_i1.p1 TRINITY_DN11529_c0_g1~~TRINITY_DN11529_c0_g1_i1.p1  ORF type:complete len:277 (-),score=49.77 TRINITY_DN11529_c0_g1_i1:467-1276(-)